MRIEGLLTQIEKIRQELYNLARNKILNDPDVIEMSQKLDHLLNEYHRSISLK